MTSQEIKHTSKLLNYSDFRKYSDTYIESGAAAGESIRRALQAGFQDIRSCEMDVKWFNHCAERFAINPMITMYFGSSVDQWQNMLVYKPCVLFLDAHPAGPGTAGHNEFEEGDGRYGQDAIITRELEIILSHRNDHLIIIDDQNGENEGNEKYMKMCLAVNPNYTFEFWDENLSGDPEYYYKSKILVCRP
jgi:hypothetical protein